MSILDEKWKYATAEESRKPNYLRNKFNQLRKQIKDAEQKPRNVQPLKRAKA